MNFWRCIHLGLFVARTVQCKSSSDDDDEDDEDDKNDANADADTIKMMHNNRAIIICMLKRRLHAMMQLML